MNKAELIDAIAPHQESAEKTNVTKKEAEAVLNTAIETIVEAIASGDKVTLVGFGRFENRDRKAGEGRNSKSGEKTQIAATTVPAFSAGKLFKESVAGAKAKPAPQAKAKKK
jgi:DNA-binding protein HU-beta